MSCFIYLLARVSIAMITREEVAAPPASFINKRFPNVPKENGGLTPLLIVKYI